MKCNNFFLLLTFMNSFKLAIHMYVISGPCPCPCLRQCPCVRYQLRENTFFTQKFYYNEYNNSLLNGFTSKMLFLLLTLMITN